VKKQLLIIVVCGGGLVLLFGLLMGWWRIGGISSKPPSFHSKATDILLSVGVTDTEECLRWAFGDDVATKEVHDLDDYWREKHSDLFMVEGSDDLWESVRKIGKAYLLYFKEKRDENN